MKEQLPGIPEGYRPVRFGKPKSDEQFVTSSGRIYTADCDYNWSTYLIVEPIPEVCKKCEGTGLVYGRLIDPPEQCDCGLGMGPDEHTYAGVNPHENIKRGVENPNFTPFYDLDNLPKDEKPKYKTFKIDWDDDVWPVIKSGVPAEVGSLISDGYRLFGYTSFPDWEPGKIWTMYPCDQNRNLKYAIGRLER